MQSRFLSHRQHIDRVSYTLAFYYDNRRTSGFSFPCDEHGNVNEAARPPRALENLKQCRSGVVDTLSGPVPVIGPFVEKQEWTEHVPAVIRCDCGAHLYLNGDTSCDRCGREFNMGGQLLAPRSQWGEETGEVFSARNWSNDD